MPDVSAEHSMKVGETATANVDGHPARTDSPEFLHAKAAAHKIIATLGDVFQGEGAYQMHHGGSLWLNERGLPQERERAHRPRLPGYPPDARQDYGRRRGRQVDRLVLRAPNSAEAKRIVLDLIPAGSQVHQGASQSLEASGIADEIERSGRYEPLRPRFFSMDRATQADEIRRLTASPDVMLGSVHAVTETGSLVAASASGSQLGPYVSGAGKVILVVGTQKIVPDLEDALRRIDEYVFPLEDARAQAAYGVHSGVNKVLIVNREWTPDRITVVLCDEALGF